MERTDSEITYFQLQGSLGSLLRVWAELEKSVRSEVVRFHGKLPKRAHGIAAALDSWRDAVIASHPAGSIGPPLATALRKQLQSPLDVRNGLCHGLNGISLATEDVPATLRWEINDQQHSISWDDLQQQLGWLSKLPHAIDLISNLLPERFGGFSNDTAENRQWWRSEYSIDLLPL